MVKSGWRLLSNAEVASGRFHTTKVRYYERAADQPCYYEQENVWGMVSLHIVQKTPDAPSFTYATFEYADNIQTAEGQAVESPTGQMLIPPSNLGPHPTAPGISHSDRANYTTTTADGPFCNANQNARLLYKNTVPGLPEPSQPGDGICVNYRSHEIPQQVIDVNAEAHQLIADYSARNGVSNSPWTNYKLVNVQHQPFDLSQVDQNNPNRQPSTFYQANIMVETNYTLQNFSGIQTSDGQTSNFKNGSPAKNVYLLNAARTGYESFNMGGCMGCHGNAQVGGSDFSFTLREGPVDAPEAPSFTEQQAEGLRKKYKF